MTIEVSKHPYAETFRVTFDRIGRHRDVKPLIVRVHWEEAADELAARIYGYARKFLVSSDPEVIVNIEEMRGSLGLGRFGEFTLEEVQA